MMWGSCLLAGVVGERAARRQALWRMGGPRLAIECPKRPDVANASDGRVRCSSSLSLCFVSRGIAALQKNRVVSQLDGCRLGGQRLSLLWRGPCALCQGLCASSAYAVGFCVRPEGRHGGRLVRRRDWPATRPSCMCGYSWWCPIWRARFRSSSPSLQPGPDASVQAAGPFGYSMATCFRVGVLVSRRSPIGQESDNNNTGRNNVVFVDWRSEVGQWRVATNTQSIGR